jgi:lipid-A-disaccharide synthase
MSAPHLFLVAGEDSGDRLGAALMAALREASPGGLRFSGIGGAQMEAQGLRSLFPLGELAIIGFAAIIANLPKLTARIRQTADAVIAAEPDALVIIDSPEFTHRVARRVRRRAPHIPILDYVCPSVWAWRPGRAKRMRGYIDHVLALLPFEPAALARLGGPPSTYVGHPLLDRLASLRPKTEEAARRLADPPRLLVMPGSRSAEIRRLAPVFGAAMARLAALVGPLEVLVPAVPRLAAAVEAAVASWPVPARVILDPDEKDAAFRTARAALVKSGTSTLEVGLAGIPMIGAYRVTLAEEVVGRALITLTTALLVNIVLDENVVPEFHQRECNPERLAAALLPLLLDTPERRRQTEAFARLDRIMALDGQRPAARAAAVVLAHIRSV